MPLTARGGLLALLAFCGLAGCASAPEPRPLEETRLDSPGAARAGDPETAPPTAAPRGPIVLLRQVLVRVLDRGPRDFLASVDEDPLLVGGQFRGWIFRGWRDQRYAAADLLPGDIVLRVNGRAIERPEQFMEVWESLRSAPELVVEAMREGKPHLLRYPIKD